MNAYRQLALSTPFLLVVAFAPMGSAWPAPPVTVTAATPSSTYQGTVSLDVVVDGNGFDSTANAKFLVSGTTDPGGITVKKIVVQGSKKLIATIDVADTAAVKSFDIEVTLDSGRKGKGTTLFKVLSKTSDPCAKPGLDFPAFTYWRQSGSSQQLYVADSTATCSRAIMTIVGANGAEFSYPVAGTTNVGRIVFPANGTIDWVDFTVNHSDNTIALGNSTPLFANWNLGGVGLSPDGTTVYYTTSPTSPEGTAIIYRMTIGDAQPPQEIYRSGIAGAILNVPSISADGATLIIEQTGSPNLDRILRITLPCADAVACTTVLADEPVAAAYWPSLNSTGTTVAYSDFLGGFNGCYQLRFVDSATAIPLFGGTQPRYGKQSSWLGDQLLVNGRTPPTRKGTCSETGMVTVIDPATGAETPLVSGFSPDGR